MPHPPPAHAHISTVLAGAPQTVEFELMTDVTPS
jgi:hypothetical protein